MTSLPNISQKQLQEQVKLIYKQVHETTNTLDTAFQEAASVLMRFEPERLHPFWTDQATAKKSQTGWKNFLRDCEPITGNAEGNWWGLNTTVRRQALKRLGTRKNMLSALAANPERPRELAQSLFDDVLHERNLPIKQLPREELVVLSGILNWLEGIINVSEEIAAVQQALPMADLLAPMRRLVNDNFVGRQDELARLSQYIIEPTNVPMLLYGPGGVGKSTLLAKFILDTIGGENINSLPFVYLDIDRPVLNLEQPTTFIIEAARQIANQLPELSVSLSHLIDDTGQDLVSFEEFESAKSFVSSEEKAMQLGALLASIPQNVLFIIDTFEEAQFLGDGIVNELWDMLLTIQGSAPNLRIIVAGRAMVKELLVNPFLLEDLSRPEARLLLRRSLASGEGRDKEEETKTIIDEVIAIVGLNPLSLRLASAIVKDQGIEKLSDADTRKWLTLRIHAEVVQAKLYGRILAHIHDDDVNKLAYPGLLVRRITPAIIKKVLATPCGLKITSDRKADELFWKLSREVSLVEPDPLDGALLHRQDVRRIMLTDLVDEIPDETIRTIHNRAIQYYMKQDDDVSHAEEIYHRLLRGDNPQKLGSRWHPNLASRLRNSLEELPPRQRIWLSRQLGVTPNTEMQKHADLTEWEGIASLSAQRYLKAGNAGKALTTVRERSERTPTSQLYGIELKALRRLGRFDEANALVELALSSVRKHASTSMIRELLVQATLIKEAEGRFSEALVHIEEARNMLGNQLDPLEMLRVLVANIRLLRKLGDDRASERAQLITQAKELLSNDSVLHSLRKHPSLLRELTAELGKIMPDLLQKAMDTIGLEIRDEKQVSTLSQAFVDWNKVLQVSSKSKIGELAIRAGIDNNSINNWASYIQNNSIKQISGSIQHWRSELSTNASNLIAKNSFDDALVDIFRQTVDVSLNRSVVSTVSKQNVTTESGPSA